jgi:hypothetical protein
VQTKKRRLPSPPRSQLWIGKCVGVEHPLDVLHSALAGWRRVGGGGEGSGGLERALEVAEEGVGMQVSHERGSEVEEAGSGGWEGRRLGRGKM